jgi:uncharacterized protein YbjT (DUF2867 family)
MDNKKEILILGGTGKTGRRIAERLTKRGIPVSIGSRSARPPFEWEDPATWLPVLKDVETAYVAYYPDLAFPGAAATIQAFIETAVKSGVKRLVLLSGRGEEGALLGEKAVRDSGVEWTIVRASWFCQNFSESFLLEPVMSGEVAFPGGQVAEPFIDVEDVADVAAAALAEDGHLGQVYEVTGPRLLTFADAVQEIAKATGREIRYLPVSPDEYAAAMLEQGVRAEFANPLTELIAAVLDGRNAHLNDGIRRALGREPRDFADFARDAAASGAWESLR